MMHEITRNTVRMTQAQLYALADSMGVCGAHSEILIEEVHEEDDSGTHSKFIYGTFKRQTNIVAKTGRLYPQTYRNKYRDRISLYKPERISQSDHQMFGGGN